MSSFQVHCKFDFLGRSLAPMKSWNIVVTKLFHRYFEKEGIEWARWPPAPSAPVRRDAHRCYGGFRSLGSLVIGAVVPFPWWLKPAAVCSTLRGVVLGMAMFVRLILVSLSKLSVLGVLIGSDHSICTKSWAATGSWWPFDSYSLHWWYGSNAYQRSHSTAGAVELEGYKFEWYFLDFLFLFVS
jgi:hypothetical protein